MSEGRWSDLTARVASAIVLVFVGGLEVWLGGLYFESFIGIACALMVWELVRMIAPDRGALAVGLAVLAGASVIGAYHTPDYWPLLVLALPVVVGLALIPAHRGLYALYCYWIGLAGVAFISVRENLGFDWMMWLIAVVVATDVAGYFAGKAIGGPKFWPRISPKKTWSGTAAGWIAAACVGIGFAWYADLGWLLVLASVLASMASQAGDISESALKRKMGVKDSSALIPGHGGFLDRFDGMMGAALMIFLAGTILSLGAH